MRLCTAYKATTEYNLPQEVNWFVHIHVYALYVTKLPLHLWLNIVRILVECVTVRAADGGRPTENTNSCRN
jgi:hypothetical protein